jgi:hypothetical protein
MALLVLGLAVLCSTTHGMGSSIKPISANSFAARGRLHAALSTLMGVSHTAWPTGVNSLFFVFRFLSLFFSFYLMLFFLFRFAFLKIWIFLEILFSYKYS